MESEYDEFGNYVGELPPEADSDSVADDEEDVREGWEEEADNSGEWWPSVSTD